MVELLLLIVLCLANGLFSAAELAMVSARRGRLQQEASAGSRGAEAALQLQEDPNRMLSTVQVGITLVGTLAGVFGGASLAAPLGVLLAPLIGPASGTVSLALVVAFVAFLQLVIGELVPKRIALQSAEGIAVRLARPMVVLSLISRPVIAVLTWTTDALLALLGRRETPADSVTEEDIRQIVREGAEGGALEHQEQALIEHVIGFSDRSVRRMMTPRHAIQAAEAGSPIGAALDELLAAGFSRFPVYDGQLDNIVGVVHIRDLLLLFREDAARPVRDAMRPVLFVPLSGRAAALLSRFRDEQQHLAVVVGELGTVEGVVTLEDVLEEIVGEIADEHDEEEDMVVRRADGTLLVAGLLPIDRAASLLGADALGPAGQHRVETLAGLLLSLLGRIPRTGDSTEWEGWRFEVVDMDGLRIDKVLVYPPAPTAEVAEAEAASARP